MTEYGAFWRNFYMKNYSFHILIIYLSNVKLATYNGVRRVSGLRGEPAVSVEVLSALRISVYPTEK